MSDPVIPPEVAEQLGYHAYLYVDPEDAQRGYVGTGVRRTILDHLADELDSLKGGQLMNYEMLADSPRPRR